MYHPNGPARSHAHFQPDACKIDGDVESQTNVHTYRKKLIHNKALSIKTVLYVWLFVTSRLFNTHIHALTQTKAKYKYSPVSHVFPVYSGLQVQMNPLSESLHIPPLEQVMEEHVFISAR